MKWFRLRRRSVLWLAVIVELFLVAHRFAESSAETRTETVVINPEVISAPPQTNVTSGINGGDSVYHEVLVPLKRGMGGPTIRRLRLELRPKD